MFILVIIWILMLVERVISDYPCICCNQEEKKLYKTPDTSSDVVEYMYRFDCFPALRKTKGNQWQGVLVDHQIVYVELDRLMDEKTCFGQIPVDAMLTTVSTSKMYHPPALSTISQGLSSKRSTSTRTPLNNSMNPLTRLSTHLQTSRRSSTLFSPTTMSTKMPTPVLQNQSSTSSEFTLVQNVSSDNTYTNHTSASLSSPTARWTTSGKMTKLPTSIVSTSMLTERSQTRSSSRQTSISVDPSVMEPSGISSTTTTTTTGNTLISAGSTPTEGLFLATTTESTLISAGSTPTKGLSTVTDEFVSLSNLKTNDSVFTTSVTANTALGTSRTLSHELSTTARGLTTYFSPGLYPIQSFTATTRQNVSLLTSPQSPKSFTSETTPREETISMSSSTMSKFTTKTQRTTFKATQHLSTLQKLHTLQTHRRTEQTTPVLNIISNPFETKQTTGKPSLCPDQRAKFTTTHGSSCYEFVPELAFWSNASDSCHDKGGYLLQISNANTTFIVDFLLRSVPFDGSVWTEYHFGNQTNTDWNKGILDARDGSWLSMTKQNTRKLPWICQYTDYNDDAALASLCPITNDFVPVVGIHGNSCYQMVGKLDVWVNAFSYCKRKGGFLFDVSDAKDESFILRMLDNINYTGSVWMGFHDIVKDGTWQWVSGKNVTYTNWSPFYERLNAAEENDCALFLAGIHGGKWRPSKCRHHGFLVGNENVHPWICQFERNNQK